MRTDVLVIGSGAAGLMAAVEATEHGAESIVLEKESEIGGSTRLSGGYVALCETELARGTSEELYADLLASHRYDADESLTRLYVDQAPEMYGRLGNLGIRFSGTMQFANMTQPWGHELPSGGLTGGAQIVRSLRQAADRRGVRVLTATGRRLVRAASGAVEAVLVDDHGTTNLIEATKTIIATGGFTRNKQLITTYGRTGTEDIVPITGPGSTGDGLVMALELGADTAYIGRGVAPTTPVEPKSGSGCTVNYFGGIILNKDGRRFCKESDLYVDLCWAGLEQKDHLMIHVFDEPMRKAYAATMVGQVMSGGELQSADNLADLFSQLRETSGVDAANALSTVLRYNDAINSGSPDELGRAHLAGIAGSLVPLQNPPYYAVVSVPGTTHFNGGLRVNDRMEVIDVFDRPIPCLYAAGEVVGGFHGSGYMPATHVGSALIFGRQAGLIAATA